MLKGAVTTSDYSGIYRNAQFTAVLQRSTSMTLLNTSTNSS